MSAVGHSATWAGHTLMSEKGSEPDIEPLGLNVAEVPITDVSRSDASAKYASYTCSGSLGAQYPAIFSGARR